MQLAALYPEDVEQVFIELANQATVDVRLFVDLVSTRLGNLRGREVDESIDTRNTMVGEQVAVQLRGFVHGDGIMGVGCPAVDSLLDIVIENGLLACKHPIARVSQQIQAIGVLMASARLQRIDPGV